MVHLRWDTSTQKFPVLNYYTVQQNEWIQPVATSLHFLFTLSQSLSHNHIYCFYNAAIQYTIILQCLPFIKGIPWENTTGYPKPWAHKSPISDQVMTLKLQHLQGIPPTPPHQVLGSKHNWNKIFESEKSGSTTNTKPTSFKMKNGKRYKERSKPY